MEVRLSEAEGFSLTGGASSRQFCLCGGLSESTKFHVVPAVVGEIDIEATVSFIYIFCFIYTASNLCLLQKEQNVKGGEGPSGKQAVGINNGTR